MKAPRIAFVQSCWHRDIVDRCREAFRVRLAERDVHVSLVECSKYPARSNCLLKVQLDTLTPVFSPVLTPHHFHAGGEHAGSFREHMNVKGCEVAGACIETIRSLALIA